MFKLTSRQEAFVHEYLIDLNGAQAAIRAGYKENSAKQAAHENLTKPYLQEAIAKAFSERLEHTDITAKYVLYTIKADVDRSSTEGENYNSPNLLRGCELLGKYLNLFTDKVELRGTVGMTDMTESELDRKIKTMEIKFKQSTMD